MTTFARHSRFGPLLALLAGAACHPLAPPARPVPAAAPTSSGLPFRSPDLPEATRAADLVGRLTLEEKVAQLMNRAPAIPRLGIPAYDWWSEGLHGVARAGVATVFPQAIGLAATWDSALLGRVATVISTEARAKYNEALRLDEHGTYQGLTFWSPNINIFRDPRWGRGQETYGEDPYLTGRLAVAFVRGMQGDDPRYLRVVATPKHFAAHSGPEPGRHGFDAVVDERDLLATYLPAFEAAVREGGAQSVMCAYNRLDGVPACADSLLLRHFLRDAWHFRGYVVSDCDAVDDIRAGHHVTDDEATAAAMALRAGTDLNCGGAYRSLVDAVHRGLATEADVDTALTRLVRARLRLGMFDPPELVPYAAIPFGANDAPAHAALADTAARESLVLLRNEGGFLPLRPGLRRVAVIGPNADDAEILLGNYNGTPSAPVTPLAGIRSRAAGAVVVYAKGSPWAAGMADSDSVTVWRDAAVAAARGADVAVLCLGLSPRLEGEELPVHVPGFEGGDRTHLGLPAPQDSLLRAVTATGTPVVLVLLGGSAVAADWAAEHVAAIVEAWYPGQAGGTALAALLFGDFSPSGRLPVTVYRSASQLPPFTDYHMEGRTYRYFRGDPLYPFGYGLSYTRFRYDSLAVSARPRTGEPVRVSAVVENAGSVAGDEVAELFVSILGAGVPVPIRSLEGVLRVTLGPGERRRVEFTLEPRQLAVVDSTMRRVERPGTFEVSVGGRQPGPDSADTTGGVVTTRVDVTGKPVVIDW
jgi:beta-glucosidase